MQPSRYHKARQVLAASVASLLGVAGLALAAAAQESRTPTTDESTPSDGSADTAPLREGGESQSENRSGPRQSGNRIENIAGDLTLEAARIESMNLDDTDKEYAVFSFGRVVHEISSASDFVLKGFNVETQVQGDDARLVQGDPSSILVGFPSGTDLSRYTLASVGTGAVEDEAGQGNLPGSVPLQGSTVSSGDNLTDGPDLVAVRPINSLERVEYTFDEQIDESGGAGASKFGYYTADGKAVPARSVVTKVDETITVEFDRQTEDGVLFYAGPGAARNLRGIESVPGAIGTGTTAPDLVSVSGLIGKTQWDFSYDRPVTDVDLSKFVVYSADGTAYTAKGFAQPSAEVVRIAIPEVHEFSGQMVWASAGEGAVKSNDGSDVPSTLGARRIGGSTAGASGLSSGPFLTSASLDEAAGQIRFIFDEPVDDDLTYDPNNFLVMVPSGDLVRARSMVEVSGNTVLMNFDKNIVQAAEGIAINDEAVSDFQGSKSPARTIKL